MVKTILAGIAVMGTALCAERAPDPPARHGFGLVGAHALWVHAGMPVPSFLAPILENINV